MWVGYCCFSLSLTSAREDFPHSNVWESQNKKYWSLKLDIISSYATSFFSHCLERPPLVFLSKIEAQVREWVWYPRMLVGHVSRGSLCRLLFDFVPASFEIVIMSLVYSESCDSDMPYGSCPVGQMIRTIL